MKKLGAAILMVLVLICTAFSALADSAIVSSFEISNVRDLLLNEECNVMAAQDYATQKYCLISADGAVQTDFLYTQVDSSGYGPYFKVSTGTGYFGLVDGAGNVVVPEQYIVIDYYSTRWQAGINVTECSSDSYDYKTIGSNEFYMIVNVDMYYEGTLVGTLSRNDYTSYCTAMGSYIRIKNRDGQYIFYDKTMKKSDYATETSSEYEYNYSTRQVFHVGSGQEAFTAGCTLTADDVDKKYYEVGGEIRDLQGNVKFTTPYSVSAIIGDRVKVRDNNSGLYGMLDIQGNVIIPLEYQYIYEAYSTYGDHAYDYYPVKKDGKFGYVDLNGNVMMTKYNEDVVRIGDLFSYVRDLDGSNILITAAKGELEQTYSEIYRTQSSSCPLIVVENEEGAVAVLDLGGNQVIPFTKEISDCYNVEISHDGSVLCARMGGYSDRKFVVYRLTHEYNGIGGMQAAVQSAAPTLEGWTCPNCSANNNGNFCTNCGTSRPQEKTVLACPNGDYVAPEGEYPNFCPQCGTKLK